MVSEKANMRRQLRARRDSLPEAVRVDLSARAAAHLVRRLGSGARRVGLYASVGSEVGTDGIFALLRGRGAAVAYPRCVATRDELEFAWVAGLGELAPGRYGIPEPAGPAIATADLQYIVVPGVAFDRAGHRLGYGAGYYDRTLRGYAGESIGLSYAQQVVEALPVEDHDMPLNDIVTEEGAILHGRPGEHTC